MKNIFPFYNIGHFINQPGNPTEFEILRFGKIQEPDVEDYHLHNFYEIIWTEKGVSRQTIDDSEYNMRANSIFIISPNQVHRFEEWRQLSGGTILFTEDFYLLNRTSKDTLFQFRCLDNYYSDPGIQFTRGGFNELLLTIRQMELEQGRKDRDPLIIQSYLHILLSQIQRFNDNRLKTPISRKYLLQFKLFKQCLEEHFQKNESAAFYARQLHVTQHHLNVICKEVTNRTTTDVITTRSILEAKRLLSFSDKTISEIAVDLNFSDSSHFAKVFKSHTKQSPQEFKGRMSENYRRK